MKRFGIITSCALTVLMSVTVALGAERFPPPDFVETRHVIPSPTVPPPRADFYEYMDVAALAAALGLGTYLVLKKRSRRWILWLMVFSLAYFGFRREGCVCPIGSIQNVTLSIFDAQYAIPVTVLLFFALPLLFTLFFGRIFCGSVCPLGAIQDLVVLKPMVIPRWLESGLRLLGYMYLAGAVLFAATGSAFIICRYDPFVAFFRMSGSLNMLIIGASLLGLGVFIARPYCRFLCPYGMILRQLSRISRRRVTITPDECIRCRLCEDMCPFGAILKPAAEWTADYYVRSRRLLGALLVALPLLMFVGGLAGSAVKGVTSRVHATVRLAERVYLEDAGKAKGTTDASTAFRATGKKPEQLYQEAAAIVKRFGAGGRLAGGFMGLVVGLKLIGLTVNRQRKDYEADRAGCLACGRCFAYCPREQLRLKKQKEVIVKT